MRDNILILVISYIAIYSVASVYSVISGDEIEVIPLIVSTIVGYSVANLIASKG